MFGLLANIFGYVLNFIYNFVGNYGIAIIIFTIILRLILLPINLNQQKTMKKTAKMQGKLKELQDKYSNDSVRLSQEMQNLYKEEKISPFSGCLTSILQLIIIISMFYLVANPLTYMEHLPEEQISGYKEQLEEMGVSTTNYVEISIIKNIGSTDEDAYLNMNFLGLDLSDVPTYNYSDPKVFIIPLLYVTSSIISMKLSLSMTSKKKKEETEDAKKEDEKLVKVDEQKDQLEMMESMNRSMRYTMPIMTLLVALIAPLGLALYWFVSNLIMITERVIINKCFKDEDE